MNKLEKTQYKGKNLLTTKNLLTGFSYILAAILVVSAQISFSIEPFIIFFMIFPFTYKIVQKTIFKSYDLYKLNNKISRK